jgi:hypothetical protein
MDDQELASQFAKLAGKIAEQGVVDPETGEIHKVRTITARIKHEGEQRQAKPKAKRSPYNAWAQVNLARSERLVEMLANQELTHGEKAAWMGYLTFADMSNRITVSQKIVAQRLGMTEKTMSNATQNLVKHGYLDRIDDETGSCFAIPADMAYRGSWKNFQKD